MSEEEHKRFVQLARYYAHQVIISRDPTSSKAEREKALHQMKLVDNEQERLLYENSIPKDTRAVPVEP
jgi:hypothetical protein